MTDSGSQLETSIHPTAIIESGAELGRGVTVGPYSIIGPQVKLGDGCRVGPHVVIEGRTTIGSQSEIFQFASVGSKPQDLKFSGEPSTVVIGARNIIREFVTIQPGTRGDKMTTVIGDGNLFMANSHVGHDCVVGSNNVFANSVGLAGHVKVHNGAVIGGMVGVHQFCRVGSNVMLSGGAMVGQDIPPFTVGQGDRCDLRGINVLGMERAGYTAEEISETKRVYRQLFVTSGNLAEKIQQLSPALKSSRPIVILLDFLNAPSARGISSVAKK